ncbi:MAG TPA: ArsR family transcriptional regulator [Gemmatimonadaceae bacterium]|jgi:predicted ArsR family transcriptional regulator|nr:ArsR family transcriptional regulator [Gemmatimonadaceae bacterium]
MRWWERQIGGPVRGRIIALLRRGRTTVEELAAEMHVTDNAVRPQLQLLEQEGIVRATGTRHGGGAGKPATTYEISPAAEPALSAAYAPVLAALLESLADRMSPKALDALLRDVGKRMGPARPGNDSLDKRVRAAASLLSSLGGELDVERTATGYVLRGFACPLAAAVRAEPNSCHAIEELVSAVVGSPVRECCDRSEGARCRFEIVAHVS